MNENEIISSVTKFGYTINIIRCTSNITITLLKGSKILYTVNSTDSIQFDGPLAEISRVEHCDKSNTDLVKIVVSQQDPSYCFVAFLYVDYMDNVTVHGFTESTVFRKGVLCYLDKIIHAPDDKLIWRT